MTSATSTEITNAEFLDAIFGYLKPEERLWVAWFKTPPGMATELDWAGTPTSNTSRVFDRLDSNCYFSVAAVKAHDGRFKRRKQNFSRMACVVVDDAITTMDCSWKLKTSVGKHQIGFILSEEINDVETAGRLQKELSRQNLVPADENGYNPVRYVRLPAASNTNYGEPVACKLIEWNPENTYTVEQIAREFDLNYEFIINGGRKDVSRAIATLNRESDNDLIQSIVTGNGYHDQINKLAARYRTRGMDYPSVVQTLRGIMSAVQNKDDRWQSRFDDIERSTQGAFEKFLPVNNSTPFGDDDHVLTESKSIPEVVRNKDNIALALKMVDDAQDYDAIIERVIPAIRKLTGITRLDIKSIAKRISMRATTLRMTLARSDIEPMLITDEMRAIDEAKTRAISSMAADTANGSETSDGLKSLLSWVFVEADGGYFINPVDGRIITRSSFNLLYVGAPIPATSSDGPPNPDEFFILAGGKVVHNVIYLPDAYREDDPVVFVDGIKRLNTYKPINVPEVPDGWAAKTSWRVFKAHIERLFSEVESKMIIDYLAHTVQFPGRKIRWGLLIKGQQGDGKTTLARVASMVMGGGAVRVVSNESLQSSFNGWAFGSCLLAIEEVRAVGHSRYDVLNKLKPLVTNDVIEIVRKGKDGFEVPNTANIIAMTNHEDALPLDNSDRRWGVAFTKFKSRQEVIEELPREYFDALYEVIESDIGSIRGWLLSINLDGFFRHAAPEMSESKQAMAKAAMSEEAEGVAIALERTHYKGIGQNFVDIQVLQLVMRNEIGIRISDVRVSKLLKNMGWERLSRAFKVGGSVKTVYAVAGSDPGEGNYIARSDLLNGGEVVVGSSGYSVF